MPRLVKGGKYVFGWSVINKDGLIIIPEEARKEYKLNVVERVILMPGSKTSGGFIIARKTLLERSRLSNILTQNTDLNQFRINEGHGLESHKEFLTLARSASSERQMEWKFLTGEGNLLALSYKMTGRYIAEVPGFQIPMGKKVSSDALFLFRLKDGKIVEAWDQGNTKILD